MRIKITHIIIIFVILGVLFVFGWKSGFQMQSAQSVNKEYSTIQELINHTSFDFIIPNNIANDTLVSTRSIMGNMVEIETMNYLFRAAPFIAYNVEPSGDYTKTEVDNRYINSDETLYVRYRAEGNKTLVTLKIDNVAYSIIYNTYVDENKALTELGINKDEMEIFEYTPEMDKENSETNINDDTSQLGDGTDDSSKNISFRLFESDEMNVQFMIPETDASITEVCSGNSLSILMNMELAFTIEYYEPKEDGTNTYDLSQFTGGCIELGDGYLLRYLDTQDNIIINNIDIIASTFKAK